MDRRSFIKTSGIIAAQTSILSGCSAAASTQEQKTPQVQSFVNPFEQPGNWYKAALHVHTTTSDGDVDAPTRLSQYRKLGYDIVAVTDHWKTNDLSAFSDDKFLAICGMEAHPKTGTGAPKHHFVCLDLPHPFELDQNLPAQELLNKVMQAGGKLIYAHPYWTSHTIAEMSEVNGYIGVEVFNAVAHTRWGDGISSVHWDQMLNKGRMLYGFATDDVHKTTEINVGWTMIKASSLQKNDVMDAIVKGSFYASFGPEIKDFRIQNGAATLTCSPASAIRFQSDGQAGGHIFYAEEGKLLTTASWEFKRVPKWIRAEVIDPANKMAWTNPLLIDKSKLMKPASKKEAAK